MKFTTLGFMIFALGGAMAGDALAQKDVLANNPDLFLPVTGDKELGYQTRDEWLAASQFNARSYWEAWNCKDKPCDDVTKKKIRAIARLVPRTRANWGLFFKPKG